MKIQTIASGSSGNCTAMHLDDGRIILFDCGMPFAKVQKALNYRTRDIVGILLSHRHGDHCRHDDQFVARGIPVICPSGAGLVPVTLPSIRVTAIDLIHDVVNYGYIVDYLVHRIVYITDTAYVRERIEAMTHLIVECNYDEGSLERSDQDPDLKARIKKNHMGLQTLLNFLTANSLESLAEIYLVHMSKNNCDWQLCREKVTAVGVPVFLPSK